MKEGTGRRRGRGKRRKNRKGRRCRREKGEDRWVKRRWREEREEGERWRREGRKLRPKVQMWHWGSVNSFRGKTKVSCNVGE